MKKHLRPILSLFFLIAILILPYFVFAQTGVSEASSSLGMLKAVAETGGYEQSSLPIIVGTIIRAAFSLLGAVFIILIILGGYEWMIAEGSEEKVTKAKNYIKRAIIGLIVTLSAWAIWTFILDRFILG